MAKRQNHNVQPIKDSNVLKQVQDTLLHNFQAGRRNYTIFQLGKATLLRVSDVLSLEYLDVFTTLMGYWKSEPTSQTKKQVSQTPFTSSLSSLI